VVAAGGTMTLRRKNQTDNGSGLGLPRPGLAPGRIITIALDGTPSPLLKVYVGLELGHGMESFVR
jgi:hypothetical protein